ncbi:hypothetical protein P4C99_03675 [Pontiellaceae bacterium B1224]|nr:hypothetical protein [Pontiellaceae bacterium B1224]
MPKLKKQHIRNVLLLNVQDNSDAKIDDSTFEQAWNWIATPAGWKPEDDIPFEIDQLDGIVVFSKLYEEQAIRELCETLHATPRLKGVPILVAVTQYQMPLANRIKKLEMGEFVFSPLHEKDLLKRFDSLSG